MFKKIGTVYRTLRYLKISQIIYQVKFRLGLKLTLRTSIKIRDEFAEIKTFRYLVSSNLFKTNPYEFQFLNQKVAFKGEIDWNYNSNGKLWNYNLNYFDFITSPRISDKQIIKIIHSYFKQYWLIKNGKEAYPTSLRIINLIKIYNRFNCQELKFILKNDICRLLRSIEYHIQGNHLLENAFALFFAAHLFPENKILITKSIELLEKQLNEQILQDGGHYERSYMYHNIMLGRILDSISLSVSNPTKWNKEILPLLKCKAEQMIKWTKNISNDGKIFVRFNDSVEGISPDYDQLITFAAEVLNKIDNDSALDDSGYRTWHLDNFFVTMNIGEITPNYQPGHSHADTLSFTVHHKGIPLIVDPGISTYQTGLVRLRERSTINHNTVTVNGTNNNEVWGAFRVGRRAKTKILSDTSSKLEVAHDGYNSFKITHLRKWEKKGKEIRILDSILGFQNLSTEAHFHFHPSTLINQKKKSLLLLNNHIQFEISNYDTIELKQYEYCLGFNQTIPATKVTISFRSYLAIAIRE